MICAAFLQISISSAPVKRVFWGITPGYSRALFWRQAGVYNSLLPPWEWCFSHGAVQSSANTAWHRLSIRQAASKGYFTSWKSLEVLNKYAYSYSRCHVLFHQGIFLHLLHGETHARLKVTALRSPCVKWPRLAQMWSRVTSNGFRMTQVFLLCPSLSFTSVRFAS